MGPAAMPASPPSQIQPPKSARRSYLIVVLCDADVAVDAEPLAVPFRVLRDAGITTSFASPSGRIAPAFDALRIVIEDGGDDDFLVDLLRRGGRKASLKRARAPRISYDGVMFVGPSQSHDPPSVACAKARQIGQRMRDLGCVVGALGSGLAMLAYLNDRPPPTDAPMLRGVYAHTPWASIPGLGEAIVAAGAVPDLAPRRARRPRGHRRVAAG